MKFFHKLTLGSKILLGLLLTALLSIALTGYLGYTGGRSGLTDAVFAQLTSLRNVQSQAISDDFDRSEQYVLTLSEAPMVIEAVRDFKAAVRGLGETPISGEQRSRLVDYYEEKDIPRLAKITDTNPVAQTFLPFKPEEQYLQYYYIAANPYPVGEKYKLAFAEDGSEYSNIHRRVHSRFRNILKRMNFYDLYLIDADSGRVLYSVNKEVDFLTNLRDGPFINSNLAAALSKSVTSRDPYFVDVVDFKPYRPTYGRPSAFITTPIFDGDRLIGVLALQLLGEQLTKTTTFDGQWQDAGLGKTGEVYLVGEDLLLRTLPRLFIEDKQAYFRALDAGNLDPEDIQKIRDAGDPILIQKIDTEAVRNALAGDSGASFYKDYRGVPVLGAYKPVKLGDFRWALVAKKDESEAFAPVNSLTRRLVVTTAILIPLFTLFAMAFSRFLARPISLLINMTKKLVAGERDVRVKLDSRDEIGELASRFNDLAGSLDEKDRLIDEKTAENRRLLLNILPEKVVKRLHRGERVIADSFPELTVIYVEIVGIDDSTDSASLTRTVNMLNEIIGAFDETAELFGVEKFKSGSGGYLAVCGLSIPRVDHAKRGVDFCLALLKLIHLFNQKEGTELSLKIGVHCGPVAAAIVGKTKLVYDIWGETVRVAFEIHRQPHADRVQTSDAIRSALEGLYAFDRLGEIGTAAGRTIGVWSARVVVPETTREEVRR